MTSTQKQSPLARIAAALAEIDSLDDLQEAQDALKARWEALRRKGVREISVGQRVSFELRNGREAIGRVKKKNRKTVRVMGESIDGEPVSEFHPGWNVSPSFLTILD